jgi:signal transduction histidine kinase
MILRSTPRKNGDHMAGPGPSFLPDTDSRRAPSAKAVRDHVLDERKRSFMRMVSHELRTPLNSIIGFSEIIACELYGPLGDQRYREHAEVIRASWHKMLQLVNQIMEIVRLETGMADLDIRPEPVLAAVDDAVNSLVAEADDRDVDIEVEASDPGLQVMADARGLKSVLRHLIQNAVSFSPDGGRVLVAVRARGREVAIEVRDQGEGIPAKDLARMMRPFEQGEAALTRRAGGAGLGLPIVKLMCDAMGGRLRLQRAQGGGLLATVRLPAAGSAGVEAA